MTNKTLNQRCGACNSFIVASPEERAAWVFGDNLCFQCGNTLSYSGRVWSEISQKYVTAADLGLPNSHVANRLADYAAILSAKGADGVAGSAETLSSAEYREALLKPSYALANIASLQREQSDRLQQYVGEVAGELIRREGAIRLLQQERDRLLAAVQKAEETFRNYGDLHAAKPDAEKAQRNYDLADEMQRAITHS